MSWHKYYRAPLTLEGLLGNLYGQRDFLIEIVSSHPNKVLEVGTGSGGMSIFLSWLGISIVGIDIDPEVVNKAILEANQLHSPAKFEVADTFQLPYGENAFDLIFHQGLLEHFSDDDIRRMLTEQLRVARRVVLSVPNSWYPRKDFGDERLMSKHRWESILSSFNIVKSYYYCPKRFPRPWLWLKPVQYLAVIEKKTGPIPSPSGS